MSTQPVLSIDRDSTVNNVTLAHPGAMAVFKAFAIDACCGGSATLAVAAERDGADLAQLLRALAQCAPASRQQDVTAGCNHHSTTGTVSSATTCNVAQTQQSSVEE